MPPPLLKVTLAGLLLLLGAVSFLQVQAAYEPSPEQLEADLKWATAEIAKVKGSASNQSIDASTLVVSIDKFISGRFNREKDAEVRRTLEASHGRLWEDYLRSLGYLSPGETLDREATPLVELTPAKIKEGTLRTDAMVKTDALVKTDSAIKYPYRGWIIIGYSFMYFYETYQREVLLPGALPSQATGIWPFTKVPFKVRVANMVQMAFFITMLEWTLQLKEEEEAAAKRVAEKARGDTAAYLERELTALDTKRQRNGIPLANFLGLLTSYLDHLREERAEEFLADYADAKGLKAYFVPFLRFLGVYPALKVLPEKAPSFLQVDWKASGNMRIASEALDRAAVEYGLHYGESSTYRVSRIIGSFFREYYAEVVVKGRGQMPTDATWKIQRQAEYLTLGRWAIQMWKGMPIWEKPFPVKKGLKIAGGVLGAGLAARYGLPPLWKALFGKASENVTSEEHKEREEGEMVYAEEDKKKAAKPAKPQEAEAEEPEVYEADEEDDDGGGSGSRTWMYLLVALAVLLTINVTLLCCCCCSFFGRSRSGSGSSGSSQSSNASATPAATLSLNSSFSGGAPPPPPVVWPTYANGPPHPDAYSTPQPEPIYDTPQPHLYSAPQPEPSYTSPVTENIPEPSASFGPGNTARPHGN